jgi:hypothetical protein
MVKNIKRAVQVMATALTDGDKDSTDSNEEHDDTNKIKKNMTMPSFKVIEELLRNREKFLARTRFDKDNMNKLWEVCQLRPRTVKIKDFLMGEGVLVIFQGAPRIESRTKTKKASRFF